MQEEGNRHIKRGKGVGGEISLRVGKTIAHTARGKYHEMFTNGYWGWTNSFEKHGITRAGLLKNHANLLSNFAGKEQKQK